jgi:hypothetical protein
MAKSETDLLKSLRARGVRKKIAKQVTRATSGAAFATDRRSGVRQRRRPRVRASERLTRAVSLPSAGPDSRSGLGPRHPPLATGAVRMFAQRLRRDT